MKELTVTEFFGLLGTLVIVGALGMIITHGGQTAKVVKASGDAFTSMLKAATFQSK